MLAADNAPQREGWPMHFIDDEVVRRAVFERELDDQQQENGIEKRQLSEAGPMEAGSTLAITNNTTNRQIIKVLQNAIQVSNSDFQSLYSQAEQALIAKMINLLIMSVVGYVAILLVQLISFLQAVDGPGAAGLGLALLFYPIIIVAFVGRVINLASTFLEIRRIRMLKEATAFDIQLNQGKAIMQDLKKRAKTIRVGNNSIFIEGDNSGKVNTGTTIEIHQGAAAADVLALLLAYTKDNAEANEHAKKIALEMAKPKPNKSLIFAAWSAIVALLPQVKNVVDIATGMATLLGL
jgi:hypothetical protein